MPDKLTDNEIKKALEICVSEHLGCEDGCPLDGMNCGDEIPKLALDLINRKDQENDSLKAEIERLKVDIALYKSAKKILVPNITDEGIKFKEYETLFQKIKVEAYKECFEKIEQRDVSESDFYIMVKKTKFNNLLNELVGGSDGDN